MLSYDDEFCHLETVPIMMDCERAWRRSRGILRLGICRKEGNRTSSKAMEVATPNEERETASKCF